MIVVERTFAVTAAPEAVLTYLTDLTNTPHWDRAVERATRDAPGPIAPGATWHQIRKVVGITTELTYTLITKTPDRVVLHARNEGATCIDTIWLTPVPAGTEITYRVELELHGLAKLAMRFLQPEFEKQGTQSAANLTTALNALATPTTTEITFPETPFPAPARPLEA